MIVRLLRVLIPVSGLVHGLNTQRQETEKRRDLGLRHKHSFLSSYSECEELRRNIMS